MELVVALLVAVAYWAISAQPFAADAVNVSIFTTASLYVVAVLFYNLLSLGDLRRRLARGKEVKKWWHFFLFAIIYSGPALIGLVVYLFL